MTTVVNTAGSRVFRKQVLKVGSINYKGRRLDFTPDYLDGLVDAFEGGVFDTVPLVFAGADNAHTLDPDRIRGEVLRLERTPGGLDAIVRASTEQAARLLRENPKIGVSVRIEEPIVRADGKRWPAGIQHVLACAKPRVTGMAPWSPVDLSVSSPAGGSWIELAGEEPPPEEEPAAAVIAAVVAAMALGTVAVVGTLQMMLGISRAVAEAVADLDAQAPTVVPAKGQVRAAFGPTGLGWARRTNAGRRARYVVTAARRVAGKVSAGASLPSAIADERRHLGQHVQASAVRVRAGRQADAAAARAGTSQLRWQAVLDARTSPECRAQHGRTFNLSKPPRIGLPGAVHPGCRCRAVAARTPVNLSSTTTKEMIHMSQPLPVDLDATHNPSADYLGEFREAPQPPGEDPVVAYYRKSFPHMFTPAYSADLARKDRRSVQIDGGGEYLPGTGRYVTQAEPTAAERAAARELMRQHAQRAGLLL